ncbi:unnamed protein product, partial [marine sediment metagenome]
EEEKKLGHKIVRRAGWPGRWSKNGSLRLTQA